MKHAAPLLFIACTALVGVAAAAPSTPLAPTDAAPTGPSYSFSHAEHLARDPEAKCVDCHDATVNDNGHPARRAAHCAQCHDDVPLVRPREEGAHLAIRFTHVPHATTECTSCHTRVAHNGSDAAPAHDEAHAEFSRIATSATCFACHGQSAGAPREQACTRCHGRDERTFPPDSHGAVWKQQHGKSVMALAPSSHGQSCTLCHKESSCKSCHRVDKPADHTVLWGERMHGVRASFDRQRCQTCHETGQCISCHRSTEPQNHRGAWKATHGLVARNQSDTTCQVCHRPSFCLDCHRGRK